MSEFVHDPLETCLQELSHLFIHVSRLEDRGDYEEKRGGFGDVRVSTLDPRTPKAKLVAAKTIRLRGWHSEPKRLALRLARELRVWAGLTHPHILPLLGYYLDIEYKTAILISDYMTRGDLKEYIDREDPPFNIRLSFVRDFTKGLAYLHSRDPPIRHGDLKMVNILVTEHHRAILSDFGVSRALDGIPSGLSTSACLAGTLRHCCPEVLQDPKAKQLLPSDIWAWGCTVLETLTSIIPYAELKSEPALILAIMQGRLPADTELLQILAPEIKTLLAQCWIEEPDSRPSAQSALTTVEAVISNQTQMETTAASQQSPTEHPRATEPSLEAENTQDDLFFFSIFDGFSSEIQRPPPRQAQKRSYDEVADTFEPRKKPRLTFQDEIHAKRVAEFVAARDFTVEETLDFLEETIHNYQAVAAASSPANETGFINCQTIRPPTIGSLIRMSDRGGVASHEFFPFDSPDNVPGLEPTSAVFQDEPKSPISPPDDVDNWRWAIDSTRLASDAMPLVEPSEIATRLPGHSPPQSLAKGENALKISSDTQVTIPDEDSPAETSRGWYDQPKVEWRWEGDMEPNGEWLINFQFS